MPIFVVLGHYDYEGDRECGSGVAETRRRRPRLQGQGLGPLLLIIETNGEARRAY